MNLSEHRLPENQKMDVGELLRSGGKPPNILVSMFSGLVKAVLAPVLNPLIDAISSGPSKKLPGEIFPFAGGQLPDGTLLCDGAAVSRAQYAALFSAVGTAWGAGNGSTTFNLPNLAGRTLIGAGAGYALGDTGGASAHSLTALEMPSHRHQGVYGNYHADRIFTTRADGGGGPNKIVYPSSVSTQDGSHSTSYTGYTGDGQPHNNMQPYAAVHYAIAY